MTKPDAIKKTRNALALIAVIGAALSYATAHAANFWLTPVDYWYIWATIFVGLGSFALTIAAIVSHVAYLDELRSN